ncbi:MAG: hypothetical protein WCF57_06710 [Pyrinomonadaceae bacterium]
MYPPLNRKTSLAFTLICLLFLTGLITLATRQSHASNNSLPHSLTPTVNETGPQVKKVGKASVDAKADYVSRGRDYILLLAPTEAVLAFRGGDGEKGAQPRPARTSVFGMKLSGANRSPAVTGESEIGLQANCSTADDPQPQQTGAARYERVRYQQVYRGIDMIYFGKQQLNYVFEVASGTDARRIMLEFSGVKALKIESATGELVLATKGGAEVRQRAPLAYQEIEGRQQKVTSRYVMRGKRKVGIEVREYDRSRPLVIDSALSRSSQPGGNSPDDRSGSAVDSSCDDYSMAFTRAADLPSHGPRQTAQPSGDATRSDLNFYSISGRVSEYYNGYGIDTAIVYLDGAQFDYAYTDYDGNYSFDNLEEGGYYTVAPYSSSYTFDPEYGEVNELQTNEVADFTAVSTVTYSISGYVTRSDGIGVENVPIHIFGGATQGGYSTDGDGFYFFEDLEAGGNYIISAPGCCLYTFDPEEQYIFDLQENQTGINFTILPVSLGGAVYNPRSGEGIPGVTLTLSGPGDFEPRTITSDSNGNYFFPDVPVAPHIFYFIEPELTDYKFLPRTHSIFPVLEDQLNLNFAATPRAYAIIGVVRVGPARLPGVTVKLTSPSPPGFAPQTTTTNSGGAYSFNYLPPDRNYIVTPVKPGYQITPVSKVINNLNANQTTVDFAVKVNTITGRITRPNTTTGIGAVTVTLTSPTPAGFAPRTLRTDSAGTYTFTNLPAGRNYTIKPVKGGFTFTPATRSFTNLRSNIPAGASTNFTGIGP